jgi:hypothetical protein
VRPVEGRSGLVHLRGPVLSLRASTVAIVRSNDGRSNYGEMESHIVQWNVPTGAHSSGKRTGIRLGHTHAQRQGAALLRTVDGSLSALRAWRHSLNLSSGDGRPRICDRSC